MQIEMKHLVAQCKSTKGTFLDAERHDRAAEETFLAHEYTSFDLQLEGSKENGNEAFRPESEEVDGSDQSLAKTRDNELNSGAIGNRESINDNYSRRTDFQVIETISDDQLVKIGEHLRIQRITSSFALVVLRQGSMTPQANTGSPKQSAFEPAHRPVRRHASPEETDNQTTTSRSGRSATGSQLFDRADDGEILGSSSASDSDAAPSRVSQVPDDSKDKESYQESRSRTGTSTSRKSATRQSRSSQPGNERRWTRPATREQNSNLNSETPHPIRDANYAFQPQEFIHPQYSYMPHPQGYPFDSAGRQSNYYPYQSQQGYGHQFPTPSPFAATSTMPSPDATQQDPEKLKLEAEIRAFKAMQEKEKAAEKQRQIEMQIRKDAEEKFHHRMQEMRLAQDEAKREIERAKREAERAARERLETEKKAEEERQRNYAEAMHRAEQNARIKFEAEMKAAEERRKQEEEARRRAEEAARIRLEAAIKAEAEAKAEAEKRSRTGLKKFFSS